ncbi:hypothetical protein LCGC14_2257490, partial [marine sediment metagenome]
WDAALNRLQVYLEQAEKGVCGNNIAFDLDMLEHTRDFKVKLTGIHDVGLIWSQAKQYKMPSQKQLVANELDGYRYLVYDPSREQDLGLLANYNAEDVIFSIRLFRKGIRLLRPKTQDLVTRVLGPVSLCLRQITSGGFHIREDYRRAKIVEYKQRRAQVIADWRKADPRFIPTEHESGKGIKRYLFDVCGLPVLETTDNGSPVTDKSALKQWIRDGATQLQHTLDMREIDKVLSTYLIPYDDFVDGNSRIHSKYNLATDSGRPASSKPNVQNIPRPPEIRDLFGVPAGSVMMEADLNQAEFRIMVCLAQDETGIAGYLRGEDAHITTAKQFAPVPTKEQRFHAKPINFALLYGGDWFNVQRAARDDFGLDWGQTDCQSFTAGFFNTYARLPAFHTNSKVRLIENRGWFESVLGHVFHYNDWNHPNKGTQDHAFRAALNSEAQGPSAQICFAIMVQARRLLDAKGMTTVRFINTVHDSILLEIPNPVWAPDVVAVFEEARAIVYEWVKAWFVVPLVLDYKRGESWGSLEEYTL